MRPHVAQMWPSTLGLDPVVHRDDEAGSVGRPSSMPGVRAGRRVGQTALSSDAEDPGLREAGAPCSRSDHRGACWA